METHAPETHWHAKACVKRTAMHLTSAYCPKIDIASSNAVLRGFLNYPYLNTDVFLSYFIGGRLVNFKFTPVILFCFFCDFERRSFTLSEQNKLQCLETKCFGKYLNLTTM
jgi:hypothetical protein